MENFSQKKILIVDDDEYIRLPMREVLKLEEYQVAEAECGEQALELVKTFRPAVILLDTVMPGIDGYETCRRIREIEPDRDKLPVVMVTVIDNMESFERAREVGATDYITKPIDWQILLYRVGNLFVRLTALEEQQQMRSRLEQIHRLNAIRHLTKGIAHDFNNMLASQIGFTELALETCEDDSIKGYLNEAMQSAIRAQTLVSQLMTFSGDIDSQDSGVNLSDALQNSIKVIMREIPIGIRLDVNVVPQEVMLPISSVKLHELLMQLIENAVQALVDKGNIRLGVEQASFSKNYCSSCQAPIQGDYWVVSVSDDGKGIPQSIVEKVFEPFFSTKQAGHGNGQGMSIIHGIMHKAGGHVVLESVPSKGTTVKLLFPVVNQNMQGPSLPSVNTGAA